MEVIELSSYTRVEKFNIAKKHLVPKQLKKHGLTASKVKINQAGLYTLIDSYTKEAGVRRLERKIAALCRKAAKEIVGKNGGEIDTSVIVKFNADNLVDYLGVKKYLPEQISAVHEVGVVNGLAWTSVGGVLMPLEAVVLEGSGKTEITGSLGDVMKESSKIAVSLVRKLSERYDDFTVNKAFYKDKDLHIHAPEGAVPKNGPSAGVAMVTALVSALTGIAIRRDVAMTGEITLNGKVLAIGGLKEKSMAAYKAGVRTVLIPKENEPDISEVDETVRNALTFISVERIESVLGIALVRELHEVSQTQALNGIEAVVIDHDKLLSEEEPIRKPRGRPRKNEHRTT
jgi:ATP-dependent Lon protease